MGLGAGDGDTNLGGRGREFPSTCWSRLLETAGGAPGTSPAAIEELGRAYWKPIYAYLRSKWAKTNEEAKDLTQDFFLWMMESGFLTKADPARGKFRAFVKVSLRNYLGMENRRGRAQKRGGDHAIVALQIAPDQPPDLGIVDAAAATPEEILDLEWRKALFESAVEALRRRYEQEGRPAAFAIFRDYCLDEAAEKGYREVAAKYGVKETDVTNMLHAAKSRFRDILSDRVAETVQGEANLDDELQSLFGMGRP